MATKRYSHAYDIAFELESNSPNGSDVTAEMLRKALHKRLDDMGTAEILEACGAPFDSHEVEDEQTSVFTNHYRCETCDVSWQDEWSCACNDRCPACNAEIEPHQSEDLGEVAQ